MVDRPATYTGRFFVLSNGRKFGDGTVVVQLVPAGTVYAIDSSVRDVDGGLPKRTHMPGTTEADCQRLVDSDEWIEVTPDYANELAFDTPQLSSIERPPETQVEVVW